MFKRAKMEENKYLIADARHELEKAYVHFMPCWKRGLDNIAGSSSNQLFSLRIENVIMNSIWIKIHVGNALNEDVGVTRVTLIMNHVTSSSLSEKA